MSTNDDDPLDAVDALGAALKEDPAQVGARIRQIRERQGLNQADLAEAVSMTIGAISRIESGLRRTALSTVLAIAERLGVLAEDLTRQAVRAPAEVRTDQARAWFEGAFAVIDVMDVDEDDMIDRLEWIRSNNPLHRLAEPRAFAMPVSETYASTMVQMDKLDRLRRMWRAVGNPPCSHDRTDKEYALGAQTGVIGCLDCGDSWPRGNRPPV